MLFFGGYSSILPYLLYLSVVWICILVGLKGDIGKIFRHEKINKQVLTADIAETGYDNTYIISYHDKSPSETQSKIHSDFVLPEDYSLFRNIFLIARTNIKLNDQYPDHFSILFLRGPPDPVL